MRYTLLILSACLLFAACKKDKFTTTPQISFKSVNPNAFSLNLPITGQVLPVMTIGVTDAEGDLGFKDGKDTAKLYIKNLLTGKVDSSLHMPDILTGAVKDFQGDIQITLSTSILLEGSTRPSPKTDTLYYEIYIKDFAKNKSNVIKTTDPVFAISK